MSGIRAGLMAAAIAVVCALPSLSNGFVYDDVPAVQHDERIRDLRPGLLAVPYWDDRQADRLYRPLTTVSFAADWAVGGGRSSVFHAVNVLLYAMVVFLVFIMAQRLLGSIAGAFIAAALFAVHPVHVEAVANVVGRSELLAAAGYLTAVLAYLAEAGLARTDPRGRRRAAAAVITLLAALVAFASKEHSLTLPATLLLADAWHARSVAQPVRRIWAGHAVTFAGVVALAAGFLAAREAVTGTMFGGGIVAAGLEDLDAAGRAMVMLPASLVWLRLLLFPAELSADYSPAHFVPRAAFGLRHAAALVMMAVLALTAWRLRHRSPVVVFGLLFFLVTISVAANVVVPTGVQIAERTLFLPSAGAALAAAAGWQLLPQRRWVWPVTALVLGLLGARFVQRTGIWRSEETFYQALVHDAPDSYRAHWARGARAFSEGRPAEGERGYLAAIQAYGRDGAVMQELGERYAAASVFDRAERWLLAAWQVDTMRFDAVYAVVLLRAQRGRPDSAAALGEAALRRFPEAPGLLVAVSSAWAMQGEHLRSLALARRAAFLAPGSWQFQHTAAAAAARAGLCDEAARRAARVRELGFNHQGERCTPR